ncbi:MAG: sigma-70 family RNA polymerase sigma factor [Pyrinomonadaceae bacterium]|nr:sigma-70 family RNA polymerase sigma factor [Pyrinomonadaceae bacterium]
MNKNSNLTQHDFDELLAWLSPDRETAGQLIVQISAGLNRYFQMRGCSEPEILVDETINRVAAKLGTLDLSSEIKPVTYFYGFAKKICLESLSNSYRSMTALDLDKMAGPEFDLEYLDSDDRLKCLDECINRLSRKESSLVIAYYEKGKGEKIQARRDLAKKLKLNIGNLQLQVHRLKNILRKCMENCLQNEKNL